MQVAALEMTRAKILSNYRSSNHLVANIEVAVEACSRALRKSPISPNTMMITPSFSVMESGGFTHRLWLASGACLIAMGKRLNLVRRRSEERRVGKECRS